MYKEDQKVIYRTDTCKSIEAVVEGYNEVDKKYEIYIPMMGVRVKTTPYYLRPSKVCEKCGTKWQMSHAYKSRIKKYGKTQIQCEKCYHEFEIDETYMR